MKKSWTDKIFKKAAVIFFTLFIVNCGKSDKGSGGSSAAPATNGYITCPASGSYTSGGQTYPCTPGSTVYVGLNTGTTGGTCPANGYYSYNNQSYPCTPGQPIYNAGNYGNYGGYPYPSGGYYNYPPQYLPVNNYNYGYSNGGCQQYTYRYGRPYVLISYGGQLVCVPANSGGCTSGCGGNYYGGSYYGNTGYYGNGFYAAVNYNSAPYYRTGCRK